MKNNVVSKRCLFLLDNLGVGGSERKTIVAANILAEQGCPVHMCFLNETYDVSSTLHSSIKYICVNRKGKLDFSAIKIIKHYISKNNIEVIWAVNLYPTLYMYLSARAYRPHVRLIGSSNITVFRNRYERLKMLIYAPIICSLDTFVFGSVKQKEVWCSQYRLDNKKYEVVHNGVDIKHFSIDSVDLNKAEAKELLALDSDDFVIGMVAQFRPEKAYSDLLYACHALIKQGLMLKLVLVGGGPEEEKIRQLASDLKINDKVCFAGQLDDVRIALMAMDIFVLTSRAVETFSNAALEAMSMGLPAVLSNIGGAEEMVEHGVNGYVYPPGNIEELSVCINKLTDNNVLEKLSLAAHKIVMERFSAHKMADRYAEIINNN